MPEHDRPSADATLPPTPSPRSRKAKPSLKQIAYDEIRHLIVTLQLQPGERINEQMVSERIGIGKTPVHQALQMLSAQGFVQIIPRKGIRIMPDTLQDALTVLEARSVIEGELARFAAQRADPSVLDRMEQALARGREAIKPKDFEAFTHADRAFHELIAGAAGNAILSDMLGALYGRIARIWHVRAWKLENLTQTQEEHTDIFRALAAREPDAAADAMRAHIDTLRRNIVNARIGT